MKRFICFLFVFLSVFPVYAENQINQSTLNYVNNIPIKYEKNLSALVRYVVKPYRNDYDKARAIAYYIASHMSYDEYQYNEKGRTRIKYRTQTPQEFLESKVGICADFADLFVAMCKASGIPAGVLEGYALESGKILTTANKQDGHAWNYFMYRGKKVYVDTTFMSKGKTGHERFVTEWNRKMAINKIQRENRFATKTHNIEPFYFDFTYAQEKKSKGTRRIED